MRANHDIPNEFSRWTYSQHYFAENCGEEVIEHILQHCPSPKGRTILGAQLLDEKKHVSFFTKITNQVGIDDRAKAFADGYTELIFDQDSLSEKVFCFQILTEAISAALCQWRLDNLSDSRFFAMDAEVLEDEVRHLKMGECLLSICDDDDLSSSLTKVKQRELIKSMNSICQKAFLSAPDSGQVEWMKTMNREVAKRLLAEARHASFSLNSRRGL